jgi:hypothetical protein
MTSLTTRIVTIALAALALAAPAANAMPLRDNPMTDPLQQLRTLDDPVPAQQPTTYAPVHIAKPAPAAVDDSGASPVAFILPSLVLMGMLGAATIYVRKARPVRV